MTPVATPRPGRPAVAIVLLAVVLGGSVAGCQHDGRDLREPSSPLPTSTTTSTTLPPDTVGP